MCELLKQKSVRKHWTALDSNNKGKIYQLTLFQLSPNMKNSRGLDCQHFFQHLEQRLLELNQLLLPLHCVKFRFLQSRKIILSWEEANLTMVDVKQK